LKFEFESWKILKLLFFYSSGNSKMKKNQIPILQNQFLLRKKEDFILAAKMAMKIGLRLRKSDRIKEQQIDE